MDLRGSHLATHPTFVEGCFGCKAASMSVFVRYKDQFHNTTLAAQERDMRKRARENGLEIEKAH